MAQLRKLLLVAAAAGLGVAAAVSTQLALASTPEAGTPSGYLTVAEPVADSYLVVLKGRPSMAAAARLQVRDDARVLTGRHGGTVGSVCSAALRGFR